MLRLYDYWESGNCYKVRLLLNQLGVRFERVPMDILKGETRRPEFLAKNPNHRVPMVEWPDGRRLAESNAILFYLADGTPLLPADSWHRAQVLQWLFFEQYYHEPYIAVARFLLAYDHGMEVDPERMEFLHERGEHALDIMEKRLSEAPWFAGDQYSIADIALYAYTHVADEGGFDVAPFEHVVAWLDRVARQPAYVPMQA